MPSNSLEVRIKRITYEAENINSYELIDPLGRDLVSFDAGSHIDLHLPNGMVRSYSLVNDPCETHRYVIAVNKDKDSRGGSSFVHESLRAGALIPVSQPRNNFRLREEAEHSVFVAGGIGITPIFSMVRRLESLRRSWELHYAARSRRAAAFLDELRIIKPDADLNLHADFDDERGGRVFDLASIVNKAPAHAHLYCCGPVAMLQAFEKASAGRPADHIHVEYFQAKEAPALEGGFEVELAKSKRTIKIAPGKTILDAILDAGLSANYACAEGICGTCETRVLQGVPDHRDQFLSDEEKSGNKTIMICCSGSKSGTLVLDM